MLSRIFGSTQSSSPIPSAPPPGPPPSADKKCRELVEGFILLTAGLSAEEKMVRLPRLWADLSRTLDVPEDRAKRGLEAAKAVKERGEGMATMLEARLNAGRHEIPEMAPYLALIIADHHKKPVLPTPESELANKCNKLVQEYLEISRKIDKDKAGSGASRHRRKRAVLYDNEKGTVWACLCTTLGVSVAKYNEGRAAMKGMNRDIKGASSKLGTRLRAGCAIVPEAEPYLEKVIKDHEDRRYLWVR